MEVEVISSDKYGDESYKNLFTEIMADVRNHMRNYPECKVFLSTPPVIPGLGSSGGFEMQLEARGEATFDDLVSAMDTLMFYASQRKEITGLSSSLQPHIPQLYFDVDRDKVTGTTRRPPAAAACRSACRRWL